MKRIIQIDNPLLRTVSASIPLSEIKSENIQTLITDVKTALDSCEDGVGLSAIQIAEPSRLFILSEKAYRAEKKTVSTPHRVFINPILTKVSKDVQVIEEGCLSIRGIYGDVTRPYAVTVQALDENGEMFIEQANGFIAQVIQHEIDHLDGILFIDRAENIHEGNNNHVTSE